MDLDYLVDYNSFIHTYEYIIAYYNPLVNLTTQFIPPSGLWVLILSVSDGIYSFKATPNYRTSTPRQYSIRLLESCGPCYLVDYNSFILTYIIGYYNPLVRLLTQFITPSMLCELILSMSRGIYSFNATPNVKIFEKIFTGISVFAGSLLRVLLEMSDLRFEPRFHR